MMVTKEWILRAAELESQSKSISVGGWICSIGAMKELEEFRRVEYVPVTSENMGKITEAIKAAIKRGKLHHA